MSGTRPKWLHCCMVSVLETLKCRMNSLILSISILYAICNRASFSIEPGGPSLFVSFRKSTMESCALLSANLLGSIQSMAFDWLHGQRWRHSLTPSLCSSSFYRWNQSQVSLRSQLAREHSANVKTKLIKTITYSKLILIFF